MIGSNNFQAGHWCADPAQREKFLAAVEPKIVAESNFIARWYKVTKDQEDIASEIRVSLLQQMFDKSIPFAEASPEEAADFFLENENYWIRERGRLPARKTVRRQSKEHPNQAEILAVVRQPDLPADIEKQLRATAAIISRLISETPDFTPRDSDITRKETFRQTGIDDLPTEVLDEVTQSAGGSGSEQRAYNKYHDEHGQNSPSDRKAWSRAKDKIKKAFTKGKFKSLLLIVLTLFLALFTFINRDDSGHQRAFANQNRPVYLMLALSKGHQ